MEHLQKYINEGLLPSLYPDDPTKKLSEMTVRQWLWKLGYQSTESKKGMYIDGHEHPDVLEYCKGFVRFMSSETGIGKYVFSVTSHGLTPNYSSDLSANMMELTCSRCHGLILQERNIYLCFRMKVHSIQMSTGTVYG